MRHHVTLCFVLVVMQAPVCFAGPRMQSVTPSAPQKEAGLRLLEPRETGINFTNKLSPARASQNQILLNGSGVAAGDVDADRNCDLYFCSLDGENKLYRNLGNWRFSDVTSEAGFSTFSSPCTGAVFADLDGDGDLDLLVNSVAGGTRLFLNDGKGHFAESKAAGFDQTAGSASFAVADIDGDGDLDVYVVNYRATTIRTTGFPTVNINGKRMLPKEYEERLEITPQGLVIEHGEPDMLYLNDGHGVFQPAPWNGGQFLDGEGQALKKAPADWGLSAIFYDVNGDAAPDLYVCNDFQSPDRFWLNDGVGHFRPAPATALRCTPTFSMSVDFADLDRDGNVDFIAADMLEPTPRGRLCQMAGSEESQVGDATRRVQVERNTLQIGHGDCTFSDAAQLAGLTATGWTWGVVLLDVDLDGFEDVLMTRGNMFNSQDRDANERIQRGGPYSREMIPKKLLMYPPHPEAKSAFRNDGHLRFTDVSASWGFNQSGVAHGICLADLDNDGDLDVIVNNLNSAAGIYRNECSGPRVGVRLKGETGNTHGIGAKIELTGGAVPLQSQQMVCGGRYLSSDDAMRVFAVGSLTNPMTLAVTWRSGKRSVLENVHANSVYTVAEADTAVVAPSKESTKAPWFEDASALIAHKHHEAPFNDFARQGLLPKKLSQLGPGIAWIDVNRDGLEDLVIASGKGGSLAILENHGKFTASTESVSASRDQTAVIGRPASGSMRVLIGLSNYEDGQTNGAAAVDFDISSGKAGTEMEADLSSAGPLALADIDGNGSLELFVGGRLIPARYPEPASSRILRWREGKWQDDPQNSAILKNVGLVSGAVWTDLNRDGYPELVLACEWGPVKIFANTKGMLREATRDWGMDTKIGWWNGVTAGDFDSDGKMDLIVSNWGLNTKYHVHNDHGPRIYYGGWGAAGEIEPIEAVFDDELQKWLPERDLNSVGKTIPFIREKFQTHRAYAEAGIDAIFGERSKEARMIEANRLETTVFLNRGDHFEVGKLPIAAQLAPAFGVNVADFDGDGNEDIFLGQNFFDVQPQASRNDGGRGLLLRGDGRGGFERIDGSVSGIKIYGEQRGSAAGDYDGDGRVDLAVTQNGANTMLFHNAHAKPGLRVRLKGVGENPQAIGAILRLGFKSGWGPAREIHGGSGYWSEDSVTPVMATPSEPERLEVFWPGGKTVELKIPAGAREIEVDQTASLLRVVR
jgi:hypothetical protein